MIPAHPHTRPTSVLVTLPPSFATRCTALALLAVSCRAPEAVPFVLQPPALATEASLAPGSSLGPMAHAMDEPDGTERMSPTPVRCRIIYLRHPREGSLRAIGSDANIVADLEGARPVLLTPGLTVSTLYALGQDATAWIAALEETAGAEAMEVASGTSFVPVGSSYRLSVQSNELVEDPRDWLDEFTNRGPIPRTIAVIVTGTSAGPRVALSLTNLDPDRETELLESYLDDPSIPATPPPPAQDELLRQEVLNMEQSPEIDSPLVLHLDSPFSIGNGTSLAIIVELITPEEIDGDSADEAVAKLENRAAALAEDRKPLTDESRRAIERSEALRVFQQRGGRSALLQVAQESGATLAQDLALVADADFLNTLGQRAFPTHLATVPLLDELTASIGWRLDAAAWSLLAEGALEETLDPELMGVFYRRAGAVAAFPDIVQDAIKAARGNRIRFEERLVTEHRYFLEDPSPSARLRASDWLKEHGVALGGYDPLADRKQRRAALEALSLEQTQTQENAEATAPQGDNQ